MPHEISATHNTTYEKRNCVLVYICNGKTFRSCYCTPIYTRHIYNTRRRILSTQHKAQRADSPEYGFHFVLINYFSYINALLLYIVNNFSNYSVKFKTIYLNTEIGLLYIYSIHTYPMMYRIRVNIQRVVILCINLPVSPQTKQMFNEEIH